MKVLILLALIGASLAYTPGMEYKYLYEGRLGMGIPEIKNKISGVGIKALITMQIQDSETAIIKLTDIQAGEYLGDNGISVTNPLPIQYSPMSGQARILEEPFKVFLKKDEHEVMVVPKQDLEWIVNLRKSIAHLFLIEPIRGHMHLPELQSRKAFTTHEPTIFGKCSVDYVLHPVQEQNEVRHQTSQSGEEYLMTRTINFDKCEEDKVQLLHTSIKNLTHITKNLFENVASRQSVTTVKLVRQQDKFLIKEENVQGYFAVNPFGVPTDKLMSITNQTLVLKSEEKIASRLTVPTPTRNVDTWFMEVASPFSAPSRPVPFVNFYGHGDATYAPLMDVNIATGIPLSPSYIQRYQTVLEKLMEEVAPLMLTVGPVPSGKIHPMSTQEGKITTMLDAATQVVRGVDVQGLERLFEKYFNEKSEVGQMKLKMFIDVCAASGSSAPIKMLINQMMKQRITPERITTVFVTLANNLVATPVVTDILKFVKTLDMHQHPIMTSNVLINVATILKKACIIKETLPYQIYGREQCNRDIVVREFVPFVKQMLQSTQEIPEKRVILRALLTLEIPEVVQILKSVINQRYDVTIKEVAVLALARPEIHEHLQKDEIFDLLMPIVQDTLEEPVLRQHAIAVLVTVRPSASWWQRLAISTWREPSKSVASFIYNLIKNNYYNTDPHYNHESRIAHFILPLTKPMAPTTTYTNLYSRYNPETLSSLYLNSVVMKDDVSSNPRELYSHLIGDMGGLRVPIVEAAFKSNLFSDPKYRSMVESISQVMPEHLRNVVRDVNNRRTEERFERTQMNQDYVNNEESTKDSTLLVRLFENLQFVAPLNQKTVPLPFNADSFDFLKSLMSGKNLQMSKYFNPTPMKVILPTELGIPFIGMLSTPIVQSAEGQIKFNFEGEKEPSFMDLIATQHLSIELMTNYKLASKVVADFQAVLPWNEKIISAGVETLKSVNLPIKMRVNLETNGQLKNVSLDIVAGQEREFAGVYMHTIPYVAKKSMWPGQLITEYESFEPITVRGTEQGLHQNKVVIDKKYTGVDAAVYWEGDIPFPFTYGNLYKHIQYPHELVSKIVSPSTKMFATTLAVNFGNSQTKSVHPSVAFTFPLFFEKEVTRMRNNEDIKPEDQVLIMRLLTQGSESRFFEAVFEKKLISQESSQKVFEIMHKYGQQIPNMKPEVYCAKIETVQPKYHDLRTLLKSLNSQQMEVSFKGKIGGGSSCTEAQLATIKGVFKVSDVKKTILVEEINKELNINHDSVANTVVRFEELPLYDQTYIHVEFNEHQLPTMFANMTYHLYDVMRDSQFPHIEHNYYHVQNPTGQITIRGDRYIDGAWNMRVEMPKENINVEHFEIPYIYKLKSLFFQDRILESVEESPKELRPNEFYF